MQVCACMYMYVYCCVGIPCHWSAPYRRPWTTHPSHGRWRHEGTGHCHAAASHYTQVSHGWSKVTRHAIAAFSCAFGKVPAYGLALSGVYWALPALH